MSAIIEHFQTLTQIPHCSKEADKLLAFLVAFAKERDYTVEVDEVKNIYISKGTPTLCLQAHYDMVCMGKARSTRDLHLRGLDESQGEFFRCGQWYGHSDDDALYG